MASAISDLAKIKREFHDDNHGETIWQYSGMGKYRTLKLLRGQVVVIGIRDGISTFCTCMHLVL